MIDVNQDLSTLTTIPKKTLDKLNDKVMYCICQTIQEDILDGKTVSEFNFFDLFTLYIKYETPGEIRYKIIPNENLEDNVTKTVKKKLNLFEDVLNTTLAKKFDEIYKNIC